MKKLLAILFCLSLAGFRADPVKQRIFLIGDSTMADKKASDAPETGWGQVFYRLFTDAVEIQNHAVNGRSTRSFRTLGHWKAVHDQLRKGDYVFIQFGHNDQKEGDTLRYAAAQTDYRANLERYILETEAKGGIPVILTPVMRRKFDENGRLVDQHGEYPGVAREVARKHRLTLIDMHAGSWKILEEQGEKSSKKIFMHYPGGVFPKFPDGVTDNTHFSPYGAALMANTVADELMKQGHPLRNFLKKSVYPETWEYQLPLTYEPCFRKDTFNIVRYGARADGITLNTAAITQAIEQANAAGGGTVLIPAGVWLTGPLKLKSQVNLHLERGALLQFSNNRDHYPVVETTWEGQKAFRCQAPVWAVGLENIGITGEGIMDGSGEVWKQVKKNKLTTTQWRRLVESGGVLSKNGDTWYPSEQSRYGNEEAKEWANLWAEGKTREDYEAIRDFLRPNMISITGCENVLIEGVTFQNSPAWTLHPLLTNHITLRNVHVRNPWFGQNNDALDLESCRYGVVDGCTFDTGDDAITIKSGRDEQGRRRGVPTENIVVKNTTVFHAHGGFVIGSEMSGGVKNLFVNNCSFLGTDIGLRFKTKRDRGGVVEKIYISDIAMNSIPGEAILFDMYYEAKDPVPADGDSNGLPEIKAEPVNEGTPQFRDFHIRNVVCHGAATAIMLRGLPEMNIRNITIENSNFIADQGVVCVEAEDITIRNVGLFTKSSKVMQVQNSSNILFDRISWSGEKETLLELSGERSRKIQLTGTDTSKARNKAVFLHKAKKEAFLEKPDK
ncbi:glycosyl hydrolase family 28 protein [Leadbetterella sp. DM7]|uniref:glycosyl hydrolase family 28 protein n=1 Tax=Leadbetterella sp. DM7 TaxID=3235085 RepID=UPI00349EF038